MDERPPHGLARPPEPTPRPGRAPAPAPALRPRTALLAVAEPALGDALEKLLRREAAEICPEGLEVRRVFDGVACLQALELARPDVLIIHARLDRMGAAEVVGAWREAHPGQALPFVVLSSLWGRDVAPDLGATAVVSLPLEAAALAEALGAALAGPGRAAP